MTRKLTPEERTERLIRAEEAATDADGITARIVAHKCAERIKEYWRRQGYDVPVMVRGTHVELPVFPGGLPPAEMNAPRNE